jgi:hypothetical protein
VGKHRALTGGHRGNIRDQVGKKDVERRQSPGYKTLCVRH